MTILLLDTDLMIEQIKELLAGRPVGESQTYDYTEHTRSSKPNARNPKMYLL